MMISKDIRYVGVNDHQVDLFEGQYEVKNGMAYNSYVILDSRVAVMDTVDRNFVGTWLEQVASVLNGRTPDYLVVQHMEPDHSAGIAEFMKTYPQAVIVSSARAFPMMKNFFGTEYPERRIVVGEGDTLCLGTHTLTFVTAPMVHWPEVIVTYDSTDRILFSADGFGKFGANDVEEEWDCEARRYYIGIVGKYGAQVQALLKKAAALDIATICPLHGPVLTGDLSHYLELYDIWSSYRTETEGVFIAYTSVYGNTRKAVELLADRLRARGCPRVTVSDLAREDMAECVENAFRYGKIVLATTTYNGDIFPFMKEFLHHLTERGWKNKIVGMIENGSWAPVAARTMKTMLETCKDLSWTGTTVRLLSALNDESEKQIDALAAELTLDYAASVQAAVENDPAALFRIGYGLYVVTCNDGKKDNGLIVNTVSQLTSSPNRVAVCINKANYSHEIIRQTGILNVNCLSVDAPFSVFQRYGFQSGRNADKFEGVSLRRSGNGLGVLPEYINACLSLKVEQYLDLDTHGMFLCSVTEARVVSDRETMTYAYYQSHVKPRPKTEGKKGWVCKVCGYVYEGEELPADFVCPLCKHGPEDFEPIR